MKKSKLVPGEPCPTCGHRVPVPYTPQDLCYVTQTNDQTSQFDTEGRIRHRNCKDSTSYQ